MNLKDRFIAAFGKRSGLLELADTNCFRLANMEGDGIPHVTVDRYNEYILVQYFHDDFLRERDRYVLAIEGALNWLPLTVRGVLLKNRTRVSSAGEIQESRISELVTGDTPPDNYRVLQNGIIAGVDLVNAQNTGVFLDMREVRDRLREFYPGMAGMLNLFSYTSLFSVHALKHGVPHAINVDLSKAVLARAMENYRLNDCAADDRDFIYGDALHWIKRFSKKGRRFSFVVFDPPSFSRNRTKVFSVRRHFPEYCRRISGIVDDGHVLTSVNQVTVTKDEYISFHPPGWELVFFSNESSDFTYRDRPCLKVGLWKVQRPV